MPGLLRKSTLLGAGIALLGFLFGLLLAYLGELHRRHNAQWNW